ncbi:MFS transporter [Chromobacterium violaceum]|uniref:MFS transporter n=1 Tax=Chromobacterium violaceum TaxID=536 RepID=UPI0009DAF4EC|nr:MFS transporter [Chromobacterium violaceum]MBP4048830.1 MFS transporter [Chromobacterium violaceum]OQS30771.1 MFS transporter [Chromobacterium violaceum]
MNTLPSHRRGALACLSLCVLLSSLGTSIANVALPELARAFGASFQQAQWVVLAYLLAVTALIVGVGRLGDLAGKRRLLLAGILLFSLASLAAGLASFRWLLAARALQGLGAAAMLALALAFVADVAPKERTGRAMGWLGSMSAAGTALGPSLGGALLSAWGWPAVFLALAPAGAAVFLLALRSLPADAPPADRIRFDLAGALLLALALTAYALAMTSGRGRFGPMNLALLLASAAGVAAFVRVEMRVEAPLVRIGLLRDPALAGSLIAGALVAAVMMGTLVIGPFHLSRALGLDVVATGLAMSVGPAISALAGVPAGRLTDRFGAERICLAGLVAMLAGAALIAASPAALGLAGYLAPLVVLTAGYALFQASNNTLVMAGLPADRRGLVSGLLNLARNLGLVTGASALGAVFAAAAGGSIVDARPEAVAWATRAAFAAAALITAAAIAALRRGRMNALVRQDAS